MTDYDNSTPATTNTTAGLAKSFKMIMVGGQAVGKSTLLVRFTDGVFSPQQTTAGIDFRYKKVNYNGETCKIQLWDTAGQERFRTIVINYFKQTKAACVTFDINKIQTLQDCRFWMKQLDIHCGDIPKILVGNKSDLLPEKGSKEEIAKHLAQVDELVKELSDEFNAKFFKVSAYSGEGVQEAFDYLIGLIMEQHNKNKKSGEGEQQPSGLKIVGPVSIQKNKEKKKCC